MAGQNVEHDARRMDVMGQRLGTCGFHCFQTIGQDGPKDIDHLPIATGLAFQLALDPSDCCWQIPVLEWCAIAQSAGFAGQNRYIMQGVIDRLAAPEGACVVANDPTFLPAFQPICVSSVRPAVTKSATVAAG